MIRKYLKEEIIEATTVNYQIGHFLGPKVFTRSNTRLFKKEHLERTQQFYEKHGGKTIIIARFIPVIRTFAPFVAGIGQMTYLRFLSYNLIGGISWVAIIFISILPGILNFLKAKQHLILKRN